MPESVLTPAPVSTVIVRPASSSAAQSSSRADSVIVDIALLLVRPQRRRASFRICFRLVHIHRVSSLDDERLADYARLTDVVLRRKTEPAGGLYIAESTKVIARALGAGHRPRSVLALEQWLPELEPLLPDDVPVFVGTAEMLAQLTGFHMHRGALAAMHRPPLAPGRRGAARRPARRRDRGRRRPHERRRDLPLGRRPRCGCRARDPALRRPALPPQRAREHGHRPAGAVDAARGLAGGRGTSCTRPASTSPASPSPTTRSGSTSSPHAPRSALAIVLGTEGDGLSPAALGVADTIVTIPMLHGVDSLNVAAAAAVALWALRVREPGLD